MRRAKKQVLCLQVAHLPSVGSTLVDSGAHLTLTITPTARTVPGISQCQMAILSRWCSLTSTQRRATTIWGFTTALLLQVPCWRNSVVTCPLPAESYRRAPRSGLTSSRMKAIHCEDSRRPSQQWRVSRYNMVAITIINLIYDRIIKESMTLSMNQHISRTAVQHPDSWHYRARLPGIALLRWAKISGLTPTFVHLRLDESKNDKIYDHHHPTSAAHTRCGFHQSSITSALYEIVSGVI